MNLQESNYERDMFICSELKRINEKYQYTNTVNDNSINFDSYLRFTPYDNEIIYLYSKEEQKKMFLNGDPVLNGVQYSMTDLDLLSPEGYFQASLIYTDAELTIQTIFQYLKLNFQHDVVINMLTVLKGIRRKYDFQ